MDAFIKIRITKISSITKAATVIILILIFVVSHYINLGNPQPDQPYSKYRSDLYPSISWEAIASENVFITNTSSRPLWENEVTIQEELKKNEIVTKRFSREKIHLEEIPGIDEAISQLEQEMRGRSDKQAPLYLDAVSDEIPAENATIIEEKPTEDYSNYDKGTTLFLKQIDSIAATARWETDSHESIYLSALTENNRNEKLTALPYQQNETSLSTDRISALTGNTGSPRLQKVNIETHAFQREMQTQTIEKCDISAEACSPALLSYYSIRNGYVRRGVPDTKNNTARLTSTISSHFFNVRFNAFNSAHSRDFHADSLKIQRTITTGAIHRTVKLCAFENRRV